MLLLAAYTQLSAQSTCAISGKVMNAIDSIPIEGASVSVVDTNIGAFTDSNGFFSLCHLDNSKSTILDISFLGFETDNISIKANTDTVLTIYLNPKSVILKEATVMTNVLRNDLLDKPTLNFSQLVENIPGTAMISIGAGLSKPVVRGLGFNRLAVINRGIVQQNQQWGADHGIEIGQFDMQHVTVYKGANSLLLSSASMAAIEVEPYRFKTNDFFSGEAVLFGATNNSQLGGGLTTEWQKGKWYARGAFSYQDYSDYRVPARKADYEEEEIQFPDKRVPNSAGKEHFLSGTIGFREKNITTYVNVSNNYQKNGLFELAHDHDHEHHEGEEHEHEHEHEEQADASHSNIGLPYSTSNHFTVTNNTEWKNNSVRLLVNTGYQYNHRREFEHFHEHYEGQPEPVANNDLAVDFKLHTYSTNARLYLNEKESWRKTIGISGEYMQNRIGGFEYFLPRYNQVSGGLSFVNIIDLSEQWLMEAGLRYDISHMDITDYYDQSLAEHLTSEGYDPLVVQEYAQRGYKVNKTFGSWSGNIGARLAANENLTLKANIGKTYRLPSANELGANGLHHAAYRYEIGNLNLKAEDGYSLDLGLKFIDNVYWINNKHRWEIEFSPFVNYYSNFIYLQAVENPEVILYESNPFRYSQAKAIYGGAEYDIKWNAIRGIMLSSAGSYVINKNLDDHNPLPYTPPFSMKNEIKYMKDMGNKKLSYYQFTVSHQLYARQSRVGAGEEATGGANLFNVGAGFDYKLSPKCKLIFNIQMQNIFNTCYLNHMSLYRRINIPEQGRNVQVFVRLPFKS